jgi:hypothetical protein
MSQTINIFEYATRNKIVFPSARGNLNVEQLWDVPLRSKNESKDDFNLNSIAQGINKTVKAMSEENFVDNVRTASNIRSEMALEIVKHVIGVKKAEEDNAKKRADAKVEMDKLLTILAEKQDGKLSEMSEEDIYKRIAVLQTV